MDQKRNIAIVILVAWRQALKNPRRTILTMSTVAVGCAMIIAFRAFQTGGFERMVDDAVAANTGHLQVHEKGWWENRSIDYAFRPESRLVDGLRARRGVAALCLRITAGGILAHDGASAGVMVQGVDPVAERTVTDLHTRIRRGGRYLEPGDRTAAVLGYNLARNLGAAEGDRVTLVSQGLDGSIAAERLTVVGVFRSDDAEADRSMALVPLSLADGTFSMGGHVNALVVRLEYPEEAAAIAAELRRQWGDAIEVMDWNDMLQELRQLITIKQASAAIFFFVLLVIVSAGVMNNVQMSVFERTRELGIMMAIGTRPGQVVAMILCESAIVVLAGVFAGVIMGSAIGFYFQVNPITLGGMQDAMSAFNLRVAVIPARLTAANAATSALVTLLLGILFSIAPARRAARLKPLDAIRQL